MTVPAIAPTLKTAVEYYAEVLGNIESAMRLCKKHIKDLVAIATMNHPIPMSKYERHRTTLEEAETSMESLRRALQERNALQNTHDILLMAPQRKENAALAGFCISFTGRATFIVTSAQAFEKEYWGALAAARVKFRKL